MDPDPKTGRLFETALAQKRVDAREAAGRPELAPWKAEPALAPLFAAAR